MPHLSFASGLVCMPRADYGEILAATKGWRDRDAALSGCLENR